jgi:hypothetical protein
MYTFFKKLITAWKEKLSTRTKTVLGLLSIPGIVVKAAVIIGAGASILPVIGPYIIGTAAVSTLISGTLIARDMINSKRRRSWVNAAGQRVESSVLEKQELIHAQKKMDALHVTGKSAAQSARHAQSLARRFRKYADKAVITEDIPAGTGRFRFTFAQKPL